MCLTKPALRHSRTWNWDGDRIVHKSIVPSSRPAVGQSGGGYDIDVREFLVTERNEVMRRTLHEDVRSFIAELPGASWELFKAREPGGFDHRAAVISAFVGERIAYVYTGGYDPWQFPDETLHLGKGDCEDRALLIASLLLASGVSSFNVRVALGKFRSWVADGRRADRDHVWVVYKDEKGRWQVIEPLHARRVRTPERVSRADAPVRAEYVPQFLFNDVHLWAVSDGRHDDGEPSLRLRRDWSGVHPTFGGLVHRSILNEALTPDVCPAWVLATLNRHFTTFLWFTFDVVDTGPYDPRDHFDNAYVEEGWNRVGARLATFGGSPATELDAFFHAAHAIGDFYAHTTWAHFAETRGRPLPLCEAWDQPPARSPDHGPGGDFDLASGRFTRNPAVWGGTPAQAAALWRGKVISGRYGQPRDSHDPIELLVSVPAKLRAAQGFPVRGSLPHHNEIAVDGLDRGGRHVLYDDLEHARQYRLRYSAAVRHIRKAFADRWRP